MTELQRLLDDMARLRQECPWTSAQTHETLRPYLLEETHEVLDALDSGDRAHFRDELGDLLMQVVFHAAVADDFDFDDVAAGIADKLERRNPHVFAPETLTEPIVTVADVDAQWNRIKSME